MELLRPAGLTEVPRNEMVPPNMPAEKNAEAAEGSKRERPSPPRNQPVEPENGNNNERDVRGQQQPAGIHEESRPRRDSRQIQPKERGDKQETHGEADCRLPQLRRLL